MFGWRDDTQKDVPGIEGLKIRVLAEEHVTTSRKDQSKRPRKERDVETHVDTQRGLEKAKLSSQQGPRWAGPGGPNKESRLVPRSSWKTLECLNREAP